MNWSDDMKLFCQLPEGIVQSLVVDDGKIIARTEAHKYRIDQDGNVVEIDDCRPS